MNFCPYKAKYTASDGSGYSEKESAKKSKGRKQRNVPDIATLLEKTGANSLDEIIAELEQQMLDAAENLEFERAATLRDQIRALTGDGE